MPGQRAGVQAQLARLGVGGGPLTIAAEGWASAFALRSPAGHVGYLVATADREPSEAQRYLLRALAQQTGAALANARLHAEERAAATGLRAANAGLTETVAALRRRNTIHERLAQAAVAADGLSGIARALHELTGLPARVEDRHGNVLASAGAEDPVPQPGPSRQAQLLKRALAAGRPVRQDGRLVAVAQPREDVLGVLVLLDPDDRATADEMTALELAATALTVELARLQTVADTELRLGHDIVSDLVNGVDPDSALNRARALGHDLGSPHRVVVVAGAGQQAALVACVRHAAGEHRMGRLVLPQADTVVVLAPDAPDGPDRWERFRSTVLAGHGVTRCSLGIGGVAHRPEDFPRSHHEAVRALRLHDTLGGADRAVCYDELGVYQLLCEVADTDGVDRFVRRWLGDLIDYDGAHRTELVATVSRYLECGGSYDATAQAMALGRSTVRYRLRRIRQVSGHDLSLPDVRFNLQLATRALDTRQAL